MQLEEMKKLLCPLGLITGSKVRCVADECMFCRKGYECVLPNAFAANKPFIHVTEAIALVGESHSDIEGAKKRVSDIIEHSSSMGEPVALKDIIAQAGMDVQLVTRAIDLMILEGDIFEIGPDRFKKTFDDKMI